MRAGGGRNGTRREFLATASMAALTLAAHEPLLWAASAPEPVPADPRILALELEAGVSPQVLERFYGRILGLPVLARGKDRVTIGGGRTPITLVSRIDAPERPFYHFAFNIPENQILEARAWQRQRTELLRPHAGLRDPAYPEDVVHFRNWDAHSVFFLDPAGNVVEYIARHTLDNAREGSFGSGSLLYASEIAFTVDNVRRNVAEIAAAAGIGPYRPVSDAFGALGDESGLLLVFRRGRDITPGDDGSRLAEVFPVRAEVRAEAGGNHQLSGYPYQIEAHP